MTDPLWMTPVPTCTCTDDLPRFSCCTCGAYEQSLQRARETLQIYLRCETASWAFGVGPLADLFYEETP